MANNFHRIIIDTNLWVSFLITKDFSKLDFLINEKKCKLLFSEELFKEFHLVIQRPKLKKFFSQKDIKQLTNLLEEHVDLIHVSSKVDTCRDLKDNFLLSLSLDGNADYLLTGDNDLLEMHSFESTKIITITKYLEINNR